MPFWVVLGSSGNTLSMGQQQRLCIARGLLRDTPILILDEPTAALDPQTENALVESLREAALERLVIVIAHRLSTVLTADVILYMEGGKIMERGSHAELMDRGLNYSRLYLEQFATTADRDTPPAAR